MVLPQPKERVLVRPRSGSPYLADVTGSLRVDIRTPENPEARPGAEIGVEVRDDREFVLFAQRDQIEPATPELEKEFKTDLTPRTLEGGVGIFGTINIAYNWKRGR